MPAAVPCRLSSTRSCGPLFRRLRRSRTRSAAGVGEWNEGSVGVRTGLVVCYFEVHNEHTAIVHPEGSPGSLYNTSFFCTYAAVDVTSVFVAVMSYDFGSFFALSDLFARVCMSDYEGELYVSSSPLPAAALQKSGPKQARSSMQTSTGSTGRLL